MTGLFQKIYRSEDFFTALGSYGLFCAIAAVVTAAACFMGIQGTSAWQDEQYLRVVVWLTVSLSGAAFLFVLEAREMRRNRLAAQVDLIAEEVRNPMGSVLGLSRVLENRLELLSITDRQSAVQSMQDEAARALLILDGMPSSIKIDSTANELHNRIASVLGMSVVLQSRMETLSDADWLTALHPIHDEAERALLILQGLRRRKPAQDRSSQASRRSETTATETRQSGGEVTVPVTIKKYVWTVTVRGNIDQNDVETIQRMEQALREASGDQSLAVTRVVLPNREFDSEVSA